MKFNPIARFVGPKGSSRFFSYTGTIQDADITTEQYLTGGSYTERIGNTVYHRDDTQLHTENTTHLQIIDPHGEISSFKVDTDRIHCCVGNRVAIYAVENSQGKLSLLRFENTTTRKQISYVGRGSLDALRRKFDPAYSLLSLLFFFSLFLGYWGVFGLNQMVLPALGLTCIAWMFLTATLRHKQANAAFSKAVSDAISSAPDHANELFDISVHIQSNSRWFLRKMWRSITWTTKWSLRTTFTLVAMAILTTGYAFVQTLTQKGQLQAFAVENGFDTVLQLPPGASEQTQRYWRSAMRYDSDPESWRAKIMSPRAAEASLGVLRATKGVDATRQLMDIDGPGGILQVFLALGRGAALEQVFPEELFAAMAYAGSQYHHLTLPPKATYDHALQRSAQLWFKKEVNTLTADEFFFAYRQANQQFYSDKEPLRSQADALSTLLHCGDETWPKNIGIKRDRERYFAALGETVPEQWPSAIRQAKKKHCRS